MREFGRRPNTPHSRPMPSKRRTVSLSPSSIPTRARATLQLLVLSLGAIVAACGSNGDSTPSPADPGANAQFPLPTTIIASVEPYASVSDALSDAANIDWQTETDKADAITLAYAAQELADHFSLLGPTTSFSDTDGATAQNELFLVVRGDQRSEALIAGQNVDFTALGDQGFEIGVIDDNVYVAANTSTGALYGVYRLLEHIGFAWYSPTKIEVPEANMNRINWTRIRQRPEVDLRGFWIYGDVSMPGDYAIWLGRNRLNIAAGATPHLRQLLGVKEWGGGHELLQEEFSAPGLFEQHPEWFSSINGVRQPVAATGVYYNPAFGNPDAADFFADRMIDRLATGDLQYVDVLNIWPADSRFGRFDQSALALSIGNETDNLLYFYANVAARFRQAYVDGVLNRPVYVGGISYYQTWKLPTNEDVVTMLQDSDYLHVFYLNQRSWSGPIDADLNDREANRTILEDIFSWQTSASFAYGIVEYYNYSVYAAVALSDYEYFADNFDFLDIEGRALFAYMHPLLDNPGPRRLTNELLSKLAWNDLDASAEERRVYAESITQAYFAHRYGNLASEWRDVYSTMAHSVDNASEIFALNSMYWLCFQDLIWAQPPYTASEVVNYLPLYLEGGIQDLPTFPFREVVRASFRGLNESIRMQDEAAVRWEDIVAQAQDPYVRAAMASDVEWFEATRSRYRLMAATADFIVAQFNGSDVTDARDRIQTEVAFLEASPTTDDTLSPVDQRAFLGFHRRLAGIE